MRYITIANNCGANLVLGSQNVVDGYWVSSPPDSILYGGVPQLHLSDSWGPAGSETLVTYKLNVPNGPSVTIHMSGPTAGSNILIANSSDPRVLDVMVSRVPPSGYPLIGTVTCNKATFETAGSAWSEEAKKADVVNTFASAPNPSNHSYDALAKYFTHIKETEKSDSAREMRW